MRLDTLLQGLSAGLSLVIVLVLELESAFHEFFGLDLLVVERVSTGLADARRLVLARMVRLSEIQNKLMSHLLLLS